MSTVPCPDCAGDGATYMQVRVGQHSTPFLCARCDGDGEIPLAEVGLTEKENPMDHCDFCETNVESVTTGKSGVSICADCRGEAEVTR